MMSLRIALVLAAATGLAGLPACTGRSTEQEPAARSSGPPGVTASAGPTLIGVDVVARCAGFGRPEAAPFLGVPADAVKEVSESLSPSLRTCSFVHAENASRVLTFSLEHADSVEEAASGYAAMRENLPIAERAQKGGAVEPGDSALVEISGLGDEALWTNVNGALTVRRANVTIQVMAPPGRAQQIAVARAVLALLH